MDLLIAFSAGSLTTLAGFAFVFESIERNTHEKKRRDEEMRAVNDYLGGHILTKFSYPGHVAERPYRVTKAGIELNGGGESLRAP